MTSSDLNSAFSPDPERAAALDRRMHDGLAESLSHVSEQTGSVETIDQAALAAVIALIRSGRRLPPEAFGHYYELVFALIDDRLDDAGAASVALGKVQPWDGGLTIRFLNDPGNAAKWELYLRRIGLNLIRPPEEMAASYRAELESGLSLLDRALPDFAAEIRALVREIVLATDADGSASEFHGVSSYQLWGTMLLNPRYRNAPVAVVETLAHESAHTLLFGLTYDEPLVLNPDSERFDSPLRRDPRPMDGIYHATFVCARMHWAMAGLASNASLPSEIRDEASQSAESCARGFNSGYGTVSEHGKLSGTGRTVIESAFSYMQTAA